MILFFFRTMQFINRAAIYINQGAIYKNQALIYKKEPIKIKMEPTFFHFQSWILDSKASISGTKAGICIRNNAEGIPWLSGWNVLHLLCPGIPCLSQEWPGVTVWKEISGSLGKVRFF